MALKYYLFFVNGLIWTFNYPKSKWNCKSRLRDVENFKNKHKQYYQIL